MSLMYEAVLRIDMGEMVNSSFHQTQQESGSLNCQRPFLLPSSLSRLNIWVKKPRSEMCGCVLSARGVLVFCALTF